ncbi:MAG: Peptidase [Eubacterium sp.]|nr:Peptidase [Eubacterium sp.]
MRVLSFIKKFNKTYSVVIIPNTNDHVRKLSVRAPLIKLIAALLIISSAIISVYIYRTSQNQVAPEADNEISTAELMHQIDSLTDLVNQQNQSLTLSRSQLEQIKNENAGVKTKIKEFTQMYSDIADNYITKTSRGSTPVQNSSKALLDLTELSDIVFSLNKSFSLDEQLNKQLKESNEKLEKYVDAVPTLIPATGKISSPFGMRNHPIKKVFKVHEGVDISGLKGDPILAAATGVVEFAGYSKGYGYNIKIDHKNGYRTVYGHSSKLLVKTGDKVAKGQKIALVGSTGVSTGPHLHFEIRIGNTPVDPTEYIDFSFKK